MKEYRVCELRAAAPEEGAADLILKGMPVVYDQPTLINDPAGAYTEIIKRGALDKADLGDTRLLYNHDRNKIPLARTPKTMQLLHGPAGLEMTAYLPNTEEARSVHTAVKRGDLSGMSFAFKVPPGGSVYDATTNTRTITAIEKVYEISITPWPAYPQTSVEARAEIAEGTSSRLKDAAKIKINQIRKVKFR